MGHHIKSVLVCSCVVSCLLYCIIIVHINKDTTGPGEAGTRALGAAVLLFLSFPSSSPSICNNDIPTPTKMRTWQERGGGVFCCDLNCADSPSSLSLAFCIAISIIPASTSQNFNASLVYPFLCGARTMSSRVVIKFVIGCNQCWSCWQIILSQHLISYMSPVHHSASEQEGKHQEMWVGEMWCGSKLLIILQKFFSAPQRPSLLASNKLIQRRIKKKDRRRAWTPSWSFIAGVDVFLLSYKSPVHHSASKEDRRYEKQAHGRCDVDQRVWYFYRSFFPHCYTQAEVCKHSMSRLRTENENEKKKVHMYPV